MGRPVALACERLGSASGAKPVARPQTLSVLGRGRAIEGPGDQPPLLFFFFWYCFGAGLGKRWDSATAIRFFLKGTIGPGNQNRSDLAEKLKSETIGK
jgi:hypothetical protein